MFKSPFGNSTSADGSHNFETDPATTVAHAAVPHALVKPEPRSQTFTNM